ncbi:hypothetical protein DYU70_08805 [Campylobacter coli]|uniref:Uncharacterized protein n=1 Tax=Campylobacter coli TaxID=195 RepID=A0A696CDP3_CAMCO|nr:hypothetical protein [Campylobacter coli]
MAFGKLVNDKIVIDTNNALNYRSREGDIQQRKVDTALIDIIKEAGQVAAMEHGAVLFSAKELIEGVGIVEHQNQDGTKSHYLETNVRLYNEELKRELKEKGNEFIAVISNAGIKVVNEAEMKAQKQEQQIQQTQEIKEPEKTQNQEFGR